MIASLKDRYKIEMQLDKKAIDAVAIGTDSTITKKLTGATLKSALRLMLGELGLTYVIEEEMLLITTTEAAEQKMTTMLYPVADWR